MGWAVRMWALSTVLSVSVPLLAQTEPANEPPKGKVLFSRDAALEAVQPEKPESVIRAEGAIDPQVTDAERDALTIVRSDLDAHLKPASAGIEVRVRMTVRNDGTDPLTRLVLQVSSSLRWESFAGLRMAQQLVETDADHTGFTSEAVVTLAEPLAVGASYELSAVYSGTIAHNTGRLDRIGAPADQSRLADWDEIGAESTSLRGFGEVIWYPVAASRVFLGDGAKFFQAVGKQRAKSRKTVVSLRLAIEYVGEPPHSVYFCGRLEQMTAHSENQDVAVAEAPGLATAEFGAQMPGFRTLSLFVTARPETVEENGLLSAVTDEEVGLKDYADAAVMVQPMLAEWFGSAGPEMPLRMIDHRGQSFEDGALLVTSMLPQEPAKLAPRLAEALSHAWIPARTPWIQEGLARFAYLLWTEKTAGRTVALDVLQQDAIPLALAEGSGETLAEAHDEVFYRTKAAAVFWMLRSIVGDAALKVALARFRQEDSHAGDETALLERLLEQHGSAKLSWFFDDWVDGDKGLPDLSIVQVTPRELPTKGGKSTGWLVAVEVRNDGDAVAEVPVTVRSGTLTATENLRIAGHANASTRFLFEKAPEQVQVNDGSVPEMRSSLHTQAVVVLPKS